jgi:hypothetical protein
VMETSLPYIMVCNFLSWTCWLSGN